MPSLVTPARRRREVDDDEDTDPSEPGGSGSERASKRARSESAPAGSSPISAANERAPNGRRMPTNGTSMNGAGQASASREHQPGAIVRVKLSNFVTYKAVEFFPGPSLNMVIGPNGTGKSTLVCAICIGLGWDPKYLGRQKEVSEFVKHGEQQGYIEIELRRRPGQNRNPVVKCQVMREANKTTYTVNGRQSNKKQVQELARSFSIQIDNLCQFLPQDKVVEFAAMSPVDLLQSTQQAVASKQMIAWHRQLSGWRQDQRKVETEAGTGQETLKNLDARQKAQEADVARVREREQVKKSIEMLQKLRPFVEYYELKQKKSDREEAVKEAEQELMRLQDSLEPALRAVNSKANYRDRIKTAKTARAAAVEEAEKECTTKLEAITALQAQLTELEGQLERAKKEIKDDRVDLTRLQDSLKHIEVQMRTEPPQVDLTVLNEHIRSKERRIIEIREDDGLAKRRDYDQSKADAAEVANKIARCEKEISGLDSRAGKQESKLQRLSPHTAQAWRHVRENQELFEKPILGPPMVECSVRDQRYVPLIEALFQRNDFLYLVAQTRADFLKLHALVKENLKLPEVNIRTSASGLERFPRPQVAEEEMRGWGFDGWALDYLDGPEPVLAALCETVNVHRTAVALHDTSQAQFDAVLAKGTIQAWATSNSYYRITRRREYGPGATSTTVREVRTPQIWTDQPIDPEAKAEMEREIEELNEAAVRIRAKGKEVFAELERLKKEDQTLNREVNELKQEKEESQKQLSIFRALPTRLANLKNKIADRERRLNLRRETGKDLVSHRDDLTISKGQAAIEYAQTTEALLEAHQMLHEAELMLIEATSDHSMLLERNQTVKTTLQARQKEVDELKAAFRAASEQLKRVAAVARKLQRTLTEEELGTVQERGTMPLAELDAEIQSEEARLELMHGGSGRVLAEFEERGRRIEALQRKQEQYNNALQDINANIQRVRAKWEPKLDALVQRISDAFAFNMRQIQCAGEVAIHKDAADFDQWAIQIRVKFREHEALTQLDAHRQSGGERAVSTVFYLMSLQALTRSPFRVVDEINQGMDPRNERLVHGRMVAIATGNDEWESYYREHLAASASWRSNDAHRRPPRADAVAVDEEEDDRTRRGTSAEDEEGGDDPVDKATAMTPGFGASQYFLITPKLLHGLRYDEGMTVLCIASGEHMAGAEAVDFGQALALRRREGDRPAMVDAVRS